MQEGWEYIFQNYLWVPVISAIIGGLLSLGVPFVFSMIGKAITKRINSAADVINIAGDWESFFHEEDVIQSEHVELNQSGQFVTGIITLNNSNKTSTVYTFTGEFRNHILTGKYVSNNAKKYESGTITVRRINEDLMSGYCTFVYRDKQVYNSPYVLSRSGYHKVQKGTYAFCNTCVGKLDCCCNCNEIDMPILLPNEVENISRLFRKPINEFAEKLTNNLYQMKRDNNDKTKGCVFFKNNGCTIYENRPLDCRLFPFDFKEIDGEYWLIYYDDVKVCKALPKDKKELECCAHNIRPLLDMILPYMSECSDPIFCQKLQKQTYQKLFPINKIRDDNV